MVSLSKHLLIYQFFSSLSDIIVNASVNFSAHEEGNGVIVSTARLLGLFKHNKLR